MINFTSFINTGTEVSEGRNGEPQGKKNQRAAADILEGTQFARNPHSSFAGQKCAEAFKEAWGAKGSPVGPGTRCGFGLAETPARLPKQQLLQVARLVWNGFMPI